MERFDQEFLLKVNPVFLTAQDCLICCAMAGDPDAQRLLDEFRFDVHSSIPTEGQTSEQQELIAKLAQAVGSVPWLRYTATNAFFKASGLTRMLDIPCGYTPRAFVMSTMGARYFGCDLPAVAEKIEPAVAKLNGGSLPDGISYHGTDATNYDSLRACVTGTGKLFITTEGLLNYFTESELLALLENVRRLLAEFGGMWVTTDSETDQRNAIMVQAMLGEQAQLAKDFLQKSIGGVADSKMNDNSFFKLDAPALIPFLNDHGFDVRREPMGKYLPKELSPLTNQPKAVSEAVRRGFDNLSFWVMTARNTERAESSYRESGDFKLETYVEDGVFHAVMQGRVDTLSAPILLSAYEEALKGETLTAVQVDASGLDYISSAGLRVLLIMAKRFGSEKVEILEANHAVREIFATTGFSELVTLR